VAPIRVKVVGAGGYGGIGIVELLHRHPHAEVAILVDVAGEGPISKMWPHLQGICDLPFVKPGSPEADADCDVTLFCTPDRVGMAAAQAEVDKGRRVIDFSGDFRSPDTDTYAEYARRIGLDTEHLAADLLPKSAYGVPELHREQIRGAQVVANPGCLAVGSLLALVPAVRESLIDCDRIVCDAKTGISGAGKTARPNFHYPEAYENVMAYRLTGHQHVMEMETQLSILRGSDIMITFTPQVVPMARGILSTCYAPLADGVTQQTVLDAYHAAYDKEPFVTVDDISGPSGTVVVRGANRCHLMVACDERTGTFRVVSHIDNLMKGQAGSAVQNINILFGFDETDGLAFPGPHP
jgi:N-acetyl-gamma-glutamyl-phosphate reductase